MTGHAEISAWLEVQRATRPPMTDTQRENAIRLLTRPASRPAPQPNCQQARSA